MTGRDHALPLVRQAQQLEISLSTGAQTGPPIGVEQGPLCH